jgi:DNA invertase Pin-like site-specific DNA recombinase
MSKNIGYIRISTDNQDLKNQKHSILDYCNSKKLGSIDFIEVKISSRKSDEDRKIGELVNLLEENDILIVTELSRIGRSVINVIDIVNSIIGKKVNLHIIKENMIIEPNNINPFTTFQMNIFASFAQLERDLISLRTKEALKARKEQGIKLGRKKGSLGKSIYDPFKGRIQELYELGLSPTKIIKHIGVGTQQSLANYLLSRNITKKLDI